jgi:protein-tyrosine-phosphatase
MPRLFPTSPPAQRNILFLCWINAGRSIMAEAITNHFSTGTLRAYSAGIDPVDAIPSVVMKVLKNRRIPTTGLHPKQVNVFAGPGAPRFDFVITTCDPKLGEQCPHWPGQPVRAHWTIPQPSGATAEQLMQSTSEMYEHVFRCVNAFLNLPYEAMDRLRLQNAVSAIGLRWNPVPLTQRPADTI